MQNQPWDKIILIGVGVLVIVLSALFALEALGFGERFVMEEATPNDELPATDVFRAKAARDFVVKEAAWTTPKKGNPPRSVPLFVSIPIVESDGTLIDMSDPNAPKLRPPASNSWLVDNELDFLNAGVLRQDPDDDGFDNRAEWDDETDPKDPQSHPPYADKLRMVARQNTNYKLEFAARPDSDTFQIIRLPTNKWPERETFFMSQGDTSEDGQFRIESFEEKSARNRQGIEVDASTLTITYLPQGREVELVRDVTESIPTYYTQMEFLLAPNDEPITKKEGQTFNLAPDPGTKYRVIEIKEESTVISYQRGSEPAQEAEIPMK